MKAKIMVPTLAMLIKQISIGSANGDFELDKIIKNASNDVKEFLNIDSSDFENLSVVTSIETSKKNIWLLPSDKSIGKTKPFVDYQNDATAKDIKLALREGFSVMQ